MKDVNFCLSRRIVQKKKVSISSLSSRLFIAFIYLKMNMIATSI